MYNDIFKATYQYHDYHKDIQWQYQDEAYQKSAENLEIASVEYSHSLEAQNFSKSLDYCNRMNSPYRQDHRKQIRIWALAGES